jgi:hypothetical protein
MKYLLILLFLLCNSNKTFSQSKNGIPVYSTIFIDLTKDSLNVKPVSSSDIADLFNSNGQRSSRYIAKSVDSLITKRRFGHEFPSIEDTSRLPIVIIDKINKAIRCKYILIEYDKFFSITKKFKMVEMIDSVNNFYDINNWFFLDTVIKKNEFVIKNYPFDLMFFIESDLIAKKGEIRRDVNRGRTKGRIKIDSYKNYIEAYKEEISPNPNKSYFFSDLILAARGVPDDFEKRRRQRVKKIKKAKAFVDANPVEYKLAKVLFYVDSFMYYKNNIYLQAREYKMNDFTKLINDNIEDLDYELKYDEGKKSEDAWSKAGLSRFGSIRSFINSLNEIKERTGIAIDTGSLNIRDLNKWYLSNSGASGVDDMWRMYKSELMKKAIQNGSLKSDLSFAFRSDSTPQFVKTPIVKIKANSMIDFSRFVHRFLLDRKFFIESVNGFSITMKEDSAKIASNEAFIFTFEKDTAWGFKTINYNLGKFQTEVEYVTAALLADFLTTCRDSIEDFDSRFHIELMIKSAADGVGFRKRFVIDKSYLEIVRDEVIAFVDSKYQGLQKRKFEDLYLRDNNNLEEMNMRNNVLLAYMRGFDLWRTIEENCTGIQYPTDKIICHFYRQRNPRMRYSSLQITIKRRF